MCVIIELKENQMFPEKALENAVRNNPDGVGIVYLNGDDVRVERHLPEKPDPEFVMRLLEKDKDTTRFLHLRYRTRGPINKENLHPFSVINNKTNSLYLMHNGTFQVGSSTVESSDSKIFAEEVVRPILERLKFKNGFIDLDDPVVKLIFSAHVKDYNKVLLINRGSALKLGNWLEYSKDGEAWDVSNLSYFNNSVRGFNGGASQVNQTMFRSQQSTSTTATQQETKEVVTEGKEVVKAATTDTTPETVVETKVAEKATLEHYVSIERGVTSLEFIERRKKSSVAMSGEMVAKLLGCEKSVYDVADFLQLSYLDFDELKNGITQTEAADVAFLIRAMSAEIEDLLNVLDVEKTKRNKAQFKIEELQNTIKSINQDSVTT